MLNKLRRQLRGIYHTDAKLLKTWRDSIKQCVFVILYKKTVSRQNEFADTNLI